jgi:enoyl-CoA hydratase/carnithine racemase
VTGTGRAFCVGADLRSWGEDLLGNSREYWKWFGAFKDMHDRLRELGKPTIARVNGIAVGGGTSSDGVRPRRDGRQRVHPPRRPAARLGPRGRRDPVAPAHGRRSPRARDRLPLRRGLGSTGGGVGLVNRAVPEAELDGVVDEWVELAARLPETTRYAKQQLNVWRDLAWHQTIGHARDWLAMSMLGSEAQDAVRAFLNRDKEA